MTLNRPRPRLPVTAVKTYAIASPLATHWRPATCAEVGCERHRDGWQTVCDERTDVGARRAYLIRHDRTRGHKEHKDPSGVTVFKFPPGQRCFQAGQHRMQYRPEIYVVRGGDWRGVTNEPYRHRRAADWVDDFANHQDRLATAFNRG